MVACVSSVVAAAITTCKLAKLTTCGYASDSWLVEAKEHDRPGSGLPRLEVPVIAIQTVIAAAMLTFHVQLTQAARGRGGEIEVKRLSFALDSLHK